MSTTLLIDLLNRSFIPDVVPTRTEGYRESFRIAIEWLEQVLGRSPRIADATAANVTAMQIAMAEAGMGWSRTRQLKIRIGSLCRHAYRLGLVDHVEPFPTIKFSSALPSYMKKVATPDTVAGWYQQDFRGVIARRVKRPRLNVYDKAVERFDRIFDDHVKLEEVTEAMLAEFAKALVAEGATQDVAAKEPRAIRHILRAWDSRRWPPGGRKTIPPLLGKCPVVQTPQVDSTKENPELTLGQFLDHVYLAERSMLPSSAEQLRITVSLFEQWNGGHVLLRELNESMTSRWLADYETSKTKTGQPPSPKTIRGKRTGVLAVWKYAWNGGYVAECPKAQRIRKVRIPRKAPVAWTLDEIRAILQATAEIPGVCVRSGVAWASWWRAFVLVAFDSALRLGDLLSLRFDQVSSEFPVTQNKTGEVHMVLLSRSTLDAIEEIKAPIREVVFDWRWSRYDFYKSFKHLVKAAGIKPGGTKFLRRSSASYIERDNPGMAMRHLGHRTPGLAERNYIDPTIATTARPQPPTIDLLVD